eukprot:11177356-Lingulodinium_polyedra.AAC.1
MCFGFDPRGQTAQGVLHVCLCERGVSMRSYPTWPRSHFPEGEIKAPPSVRAEKWTCGQHATAVLPKSGQCQPQDATQWVANGTTAPPYEKLSTC